MEKKRNKNGSDVQITEESVVNNSLGREAYMEQDGRPLHDVLNLDWLAHDRVSNRGQMGISLSKQIAGVDKLALSMDAVQIRQLLPLLFKLLSVMSVPADLQEGQAVADLVPLRVSGWQLLGSPDGSQLVLHLQIGVEGEMAMRFALQADDACDLARAIMKVEAEETLPVLQ